MIVMTDTHAIPLVAGERGDTTHGGRRVVALAAPTD
jgi:hypothetical protein